MQAVRCQVNRSDLQGLEEVLASNNIELLKRFILRGFRAFKACE